MLAIVIIRHNYHHFLEIKKQKLPFYSLLFKFTYTVLASLKDIEKLYLYYILHIIKIIFFFFFFGYFSFYLSIFVTKI